MAQLIKQDGITMDVLPSNGTDFTLEEMQSYVEGYIEPIYLPDGRVMVINEEGKFRENFEINQEATRIALEKQKNISQRLYRRSGIDMRRRRSKMKHTDFHSAYKAIEALERTELIAALNAIGGEFTAPDYEEECVEELIIVGAYKHSEGSEDILFTRAKVDESGGLYIYGKPNRERSGAESQVEFIEHGYLHYIIDYIPETNLVSDTRKETRNKATLRKVREALGKSV